MTDETIRRVAVLYADVSGSTRLYEDYGDEVARSEVSICLDVLTRVVERLEGNVVKMIGDEAMCVFPNPSKAATAASEMQIALREAGEAGRFATGPLRIKIGWHYGPASWRGEDVIGEAPVTAQQVIKMAKADEVLTSGATLDSLPAGLKVAARFVDRVEAEAFTGHVDVYELPWEEEDELTQMAAPTKRANVLAHAVLEIEYEEHVYRMDESRPHFRFGRGDDCNLVVHGHFVSRHHASIEHRHGRFHVKDNSTNGTVVVHDDEQTRLHREELTLSGEGTITFGAAPDEDPEAVVHFRCC